QYVDICPTGFTTITKTYTTVICPTVTTTPVVLEGWTTVVTVCTHCAPKPTTVTLTLPGHGSATETASAYVAPSYSSYVAPKPGSVSSVASVSVVTFVTSTKPSAPVYGTVAISSSKGTAVTYTAVPVSSASACSGPNCHASSSIPTKSATGTYASSPYGSATVKPFTGAAVKLGSTVFGMVVMIVVGFVLAL
ncbi:MAG: hypothetical protein M1839_004744, partial [Geoglossum umbratile]